MTLSYSCYGFWDKKEQKPATSFHELAECCGYAHAKMDYLNHFILSKVDPATKDSKGMTAYQVAREKHATAKTEWGKNHCKWVMEELEEYEKYYNEQQE